MEKCILILTHLVFISGVFVANSWVVHTKLWTLHQLRSWNAFFRSIVSVVPCEMPCISFSLSLSRTNLGVTLRYALSLARLG